MYAIRSYYGVVSRGTRNDLGACSPVVDGLVDAHENRRGLVEQALMEARQYDIAKKYILYREKRRQLRSQKAASYNFV